MQRARYLPAIYIYVLNCGQRYFKRLYKLLHHLLTPTFVCCYCSPSSGYTNFRVVTSVAFIARNHGHHRRTHSTTYLYTTRLNTRNGRIEDGGRCSGHTDKDELLRRIGLTTGVWCVEKEIFIKSSSSPAIDDGGAWNWVGHCIEWMKRQRKKRRDGCLGF